MIFIFIFIFIQNTRSAVYSVLFMLSTFLPKSFIYVNFFISLIFSSYIDNESQNQLKLLHTVVGHIGGVKDISFLPSSIVKSSRQQSSNSIGQQHHFVSCGSRTSLKKWSVACPNFKITSPPAILGNRIQNAGSSYYNEKLSDDVTCSLKSEIFNPEMNPKQLKLRTGEFIDDMRFMSCDSCYLDNDGNNGGDTDVLVCVCACSDGAVRCVNVLPFLNTSIFCLFLF